ncbi:MAG: type II toxin-antitoxin system ParD family antitoxin [Sphingomonas sp.]|nr:type II toxin-antitoxin system ParD family antitoxin [Sphingomonas sp.]
MRNTSIALSDHWVKFTADLVASGRYGSTSEVVREGLRLVEARQRRLAELSAAIEEGEASGFVDDFDFDAYIADVEAESPDRAA